MFSENKFNKKSLAITQIFILILGTVAVSYAFGSSIGFVSGQTKLFSFKFTSLDTNDYTSTYYQTLDASSYSSTGLNPTDKDQFYFFKNLGATSPKPTIVAVTKTGTSVFFYSGTTNKWTKFNTAREININSAALALLQQSPDVQPLLPEEETGQTPGSAINPLEPGSQAWLLFKGLIPKDKTEEIPTTGGRPYPCIKLVGEGNVFSTLHECCNTQRQLGYYKTVDECMNTELPDIDATDTVPGESAFLDTAGQILKDAGAALLISAGVEAFKGQLMEWGLSQGQVEALQTGAFLTYFLGKTTYNLVKAGKKELAWGFGIATGIILAATLLTIYKRKGEQKLVTFECVPWQPDTGGNNCDKCNKQGILPCSEYQCRSLGQGCELLNEPDSAEALCVWVDRGDSEYPTIRALDSALIDDEYEYRLQKTGISPPDRGAVIKYTGTEETTSMKIGDETTKCVPAFTPLRFGITTFDKDDDEGEPAVCKIDSVRKQNFDEMDFYMDGSSTFKYNHTQTLSLPGPDALAEEGIEITSEGGIQEFYIRCRDANGNSNPATFVFKFCVDEGPDETPPEIVTTDLINNMPFAYGQESININVYINEPVPEDNGCRWSHSDQAYENMEGEMDCSQGNILTDMNTQGLFTCATTLDGLKDGVKNRFYFRCQDKAENVNTDSYEFILLGSQPLVIDSVSPNKTTVKDSTDPVKVTIEVKTSAGYKQGEATCYYKKGDEEEKDYAQFSDTISHQHFHDLWLKGESGGKSYAYDIKCIDLGGNADSSAISFEVETDIEAPIVVRAYHEGTSLKIVTNEKAECVYDVTSCNYAFDDGISMTSTDDGISHFTDWNTKLNFYIKCRDQYGKQPNQETCSIAVRPLQIL